MSSSLVAFAGTVLPPVSGTQAADLDDVNLDLAANPGERIDYDIRLTSDPLSSGASNVSVQDTVDSNATLVPDSLKVGPVGIDDAYNVTGNIGISVTAVSGVLANDLDPDGGVDPTLTVSDSDVSSTQGTVVVATDGSFTYTPPAGFVGADTFTYTVRDAQSLDGLSQGTVTLNVGTPVWFINDGDLTADDIETAGTLANPFDSIAAFSAINNGLTGNPGDSHAIYLYRGTGSPVGTFTLRAEQVLLGQGVALNASTLGFAIAPFSVTLPSVSSRPVINHGSASAIQLSANNTIRGLDVGNLLASSFAIVGSNFGTLNLSDFNTSGSGGIFNLTNGSLNATTNITNLISTSSNTGMTFNSVAGAGLVVGGNTNIALFSGSGVRVLNCAAPLNFGRLDISTSAALVETTGVGLFASGSALLTSASGGVISVADAVAVDIDNTALALSFQSVTVDQADRAIDLFATNGSFTVTGIGSTAGSGGLIANTITDGIILNAASGVTIENLNMQTIGRSAIYGRNGCANLTFRNGTFTSIGAVPAADVHAIDFNEADGNNLAAVTGALMLNGITVNGFADSGLVVHNETGVLNLTVSGNSRFSNNDDAWGQFGINVESNASAIVNLTVDSSSFDSIESSAIRFEHDSSLANQFIVTNSTSLNGGGADDSGGGDITAIASGTGGFNIKINGNTLTNVSGLGILINGVLGSSQALTATIGGSGVGNVIVGSHASAILLEDGIGIQKDSGGDWDLSIVGNQISVDSGSASNFYHGVYVKNRDNNGTLTMSIQDNTVSGTDEEALRLYSDNDVGSGSDPANHMTVINNTFATPMDGFTETIVFRLRDEASIWANIVNNQLTNADVISLSIDSVTGLAADITQGDPMGVAPNFSTLNGSATVNTNGSVINFSQGVTPLPVIPSI